MDVPWLVWPGLALLVIVLAAATLAVRRQRRNVARQKADEATEAANREEQAEAEAKAKNLIDGAEADEPAALLALNDLLNDDARRQALLARLPEDLQAKLGEALHERQVRLKLADFEEAFEPRRLAWLNPQTDTASRLEALEDYLEYRTQYDAEVIKRWQAEKDISDTALNEFWNHLVSERFGELHMLALRNPSETAIRACFQFYAHRTDHDFDLTLDDNWNQLVAQYVPEPDRNMFELDLCMLRDNIVQFALQALASNNLVIAMAVLALWRAERETPWLLPDSHRFELERMVVRLRPHLWLEL